MAADAIARQYDVNKHTLISTCEPGKESYRAGFIKFEAKQGRSIDIDKIRQSITATRLSGGTSMRVEYFEITAAGEVEKRDKELVFKVAGTGQLFVLSESATAKEKLGKVREAIERGERVTTITGRLAGWTGRFPDVLKGQSKLSGPMVLEVTGYQARSASKGTP